MQKIKRYSAAIADIADLPEAAEEAFATMPPMAAAALRMPPPLPPPLISPPPPPVSLPPAALMAYARRQMFWPPPELLILDRLCAMVSAMIYRYREPDRHFPTEVLLAAEELLLAVSLHLYHSQMLLFLHGIDKSYRFRIMQ